MELTSDELGAATLEVLKARGLLHGWKNDAHPSRYCDARAGSRTPRSRHVADRDPMARPISSWPAPWPLPRDVPARGHDLGRPGRRIAILTRRASSEKHQFSRAIVMALAMHLHHPP